MQHATATPCWSVALKIMPSYFLSCYNLNLLCNKALFPKLILKLWIQLLWRQSFSSTVTMWMFHHHTYQDEAGVHQGEGSWASYPSAAVHHGGPVLWPQWTGLPYIEEEFQEGGRRFRHTKVRPCGVVKMEDLPGLPRLFKIKTSYLDHDWGTGKTELVTLLSTIEMTELGTNVAPIQDKTGHVQTVSWEVLD